MRHVAPPLAELTAQAQTLTSAGDLAGARDVLADALNPADADPQRASADLALAAALHARILIALGDPHAAQTWAGFAHAAEEHLHGPHDERTIAAAATHAAVLQRVGHHGRAAQLYHDLVGELTAADGPASARVLAAEADLATAEHASGQCTAARNRLADAWARHNQAYGEDAPAGIKMLARLAAMERECGHDQESVAHFALAQELCARYLPADHPLGRQVARLAAAGISGRHACGQVQRSTGPAGDGPAAGVTRVPAPTPQAHPVRREPPAAADVTGRHARAEPAVTGAVAPPMPATVEEATAAWAEDATRADDATPLGLAATWAEDATPPEGDVGHAEQDPPWLEVTRPPQAHGFTPRHAHPAQPPATTSNPLQEAWPRVDTPLPAPAEQDAAWPGRPPVRPVQEDQDWVGTSPPSPAERSGGWSEPASAQPVHEVPTWDDPPPAEQHPQPVQPTEAPPFWPQPQRADDHQARPAPQRQPADDHHAWPEPQPIHPAEGRPAPQPVPPMPAPPMAVQPASVSPTPVQSMPVSPTPVPSRLVSPTPVAATPMPPTPVSPTPVSPTPVSPVEEHGAWSETPPGRTAEHHDDWPLDPAHHQDQPAAHPSPGAWDGPPPPIPAQAQQPWPETVQPEPAMAAPTQQVYQAPAPAQEWTVAPPGPWPPDSVPPGAHAPDTYPPGPELDRRLPVPVDRPDRRSSRQPLVLATVLVAGIAAAAAIVVATLPRGDDPQPAAAPAATASAAAPPAATASVAPTNAAVAPTGVTLRDNRDSVQLTWRYPKGSEGPVLISGGRTGQEQRAFQQLPAGTTDYVVYGLNRQNNYCFSVAVVYTVDQVAASDSVCTKRK